MVSVMMDVIDFNESTTMTATGNENNIFPNRMKSLSFQKRSSLISDDH